jgi:hypothetical protein
VGYCKNKRKFQICLESNKIVKATNQNLWNMANTVLRGKVKSMSIYIKNKELLNSPMIYLKLPVKQEQDKSKISRWKEIIQIRTKLMNRDQNNYSMNKKKKKSTGGVAYLVEHLLCKSEALSSNPNL